MQGSLEAADYAAVVRLDAAELVRGLAEDVVLYAGAGGLHRQVLPAF